MPHYIPLVATRSIKPCSKMSVEARLFGSQKVSLSEYISKRND